MRIFAWIGTLGFGISMGSSFARYDEDGSCYGPYTLWFERIIWPCIYRAETKPKESRGFFWSAW